MVDQLGSYATPRADLGEALLEYRRENGGNWIGTKLLPTVDVTKKAATFSKFPRASILQTADVRRAARGRYNRIDSEAKDFSYATQNYGLEGAVDDSERALYSSDFDSDMNIMIVVERAVRLAQEQRVAAALFNTTNFSGSNFVDNSVNAPWTQISTDIIGQIYDGLESSRRQTGMKPNTMAVARPTWNLMKKNTGIASRFKTIGIVTDGILEDSLKEIFGLKQILVGDEVYNAAAEANPNTPAESVTDVWAKQYALLAYVCPEGSSIQEPCLGRTFVWTDYASDLEVQSYREEKIESDIVRVKHFVQELLYDAAYGQLIKVQP